MSEIWWKVPKYGAEISRAEVTRSTEKSLFYLDYRQQERRMAKESYYANYFPSFAQAHEFLLRRETNKLERLGRAWAQQEETVIEVRAMTQPHEMTRGDR